ncbi:hypothetical protein BMS3Abin07_00074 [bacterium BMS3Abin07]|nr:hypothetical protein BMS3Abin07_00074 [bacterium BMS3Abin07]HDK41884.1 class I SAM-dependent methyltransferase [Candidatus Pacearchaeota archaeon]
MVKILNEHDLNVCKISDYYSPLPVVSTLKKNIHRWYKPSDLAGLEYDLDAMKRLFLYLIFNYSDEYSGLPPYEENEKKGFGPGSTPVDAMVLYFMIRDLKPRQYVEIGCGLSTYYCSIAGERNAETGDRLEITCIDPYPYESLYSIPGINVINEEVQDVDLSLFEQLESGDVLFIDSTHIVKIDGDVSYLFLEVIPRLKKGVRIHIHDVHFPYNVPFPSETWILNRNWPVFWNEAMILQAFLSFNDAYEIILSTPMLRYFEEKFLKKNIPSYEMLIQNTYHQFSSIWIEKTK